MILPAVNSGSLCGQNIIRTGHGAVANLIEIQTKNIPNLYQKFQQD